MTTSKIQHRGHCQCCGNVQAVLSSGRMSKHGYTVDHGWFSGVCTGERHQPMEHDREVTDKIISDVRAQVADLLKQTKALRAGKAFPKQCKSGKRINVEDPKRPGRFNFDDEYIPFAQGEKYYQDQAVEGAAFQAEHRARTGASFADYLESVVNAVHGKELVKVEKKAPAAPIRNGEKRISGNGLVLTAKYQDGARVYYTYEMDGRVRQGWQGTQAWRKLQTA